MSDEHNWKDILDQMGSEELKVRQMQAFPELVGANISMGAITAVSSIIINAVVRDITDATRYPDQIRFFEVDMGGGKSRIDIKIANSGYALDVESWLDANTIIEKSVKTDKKFPRQKRAKFSDGQADRKRPLTGMSILPPIDFDPADPHIPCAERCLYVFRLKNKGPIAEGEKDHNFRFSRKVPPISIGDHSASFDSGTVNPSDYFWMASPIADPANEEAYERRSLANWLIKAEPDELKGSEEYDETDWACVMFDCEKFLSDIGSPTTIPEFAFRFNLHVEVRDGKKDDNFIPIIVDPDIGHPGGNSPDP